MYARLFLLLAATWLGASGQASGQRLMAHYPLDGQATVDVSGNHNDGIWHGGVSPAPDRFGHPCSALHFDGRNGYVEVPNSATLSGPQQQFAATVWCRLDGAPATAPRWLTLLCKGEGATEADDNPHYRVQVQQTPFLKQSTISINSDFTEFDPSFNAHSLPVATWFFYALTYDGTAVRAYQNGVEVFAFPYQKMLTANSLPLFIGRDAPGALEFFKGTLDDLRLYNEGLTATQVLRLYQAAAPAVATADIALDCPARRTVVAAPGQCSAIVTFGLPTATIPCGTVTVRQVMGPRSGEAFRVGSTTLSFLAESTTGEKKTCYTSVKVVDQEPPRLRCHSDTILLATVADPTGAVWRFAPPPATDNCPNVRVQLTQGAASGTRLALGRHVLRFTATDQQGNKAECQRIATVMPPLVPATLVAVRAAPALRAAPVVSVPKPPVPAASAALVVAPLVLAPVRNPHLPDSIKVGATLPFGACIITIMAYDGFDEDGDSVSVYFNRKEIVPKQMILNKNHGVIVRSVMLEAGEKNTFVVKAWNIGKPGTPNTLEVEFFEGYYTAADLKKLRNKKPTYTRTMYSLPGISDSIHLTCTNK